MTSRTRGWLGAMAVSVAAWFVIVWLALRAMGAW